MTEAEDLLEFFEELIFSTKKEHLSDLQRAILLTSLQDTRITYDQLAEQCGYSAKYVKQDIAPKLWQLLSEVFAQKVTKSSVRSVLEREHRKTSSASHTQGSSVGAGISTPILSTVPVSDLPEANQNDLRILSPHVVESSRKQSVILLVDDQPKNLKLLSDVLEEQGYLVQQAINGTIALQAIAIEPPDLILLDIHMPELDGYAVYREI